jgi:phosphoglycolate phosphatase-like HAD superfamily hydrolase
VRLAESLERRPNRGRARHPAESVRFKVADGEWESTRFKTGLSSGEGLVSEVRDSVKIINFVRDTTDQGGSKFVPPEERIAAFDQDGTLWVEHPIYSQLVYCFNRVPAVVKAKPGLANVEPFKAVLSGDREAIAKLSPRDLEEIAFATLSGMTVEEFDTEAKKWLAAAKDPRWKQPYTGLTYQPMQEVMSYLRANGYKTHIVTGGGQDFVRVYSERVYGIPPEQVVGSAGETKYGYDKDGKNFGSTMTTRASPRVFT